MARARSIAQRLTAVRNIRTVTSTMEKVAAARFQRAQKRAGARPYGQHLMSIIADVLRREDAPWDHPLLTEQPDVPDVLLVLSSDRGLCGAYNTAVLHLAMERLGQILRAGLQARLHVAGRRGLRYFRHRNFHVDRAHEEVFSGPEPRYEPVAKLADEMMDAFVQGEIGGLEVAYVQFLSSGRQKAAIARILPLGDVDAGSEAEIGPAAREYEFLPGEGAILDELLPMAVRQRLFGCCVDASLSEHAMRISSMRAATDNADEMIRKLTRQYNRLRQGRITTELAEIMGGQAVAEEESGAEPAEVLRQRLMAVQGKQEVDVTTAVPLAEPQRRDLTAALREALDAEPVLREHVEPELAGGVVLVAGDRVLDASVAGALGRFRQSIRRREPAGAATGAEEAE